MPYSLQLLGYLAKGTSGQISNYLLSTRNAVNGRWCVANDVFIERTEGNVGKEKLIRW